MFVQTIRRKLTGIAAGVLGLALAGAAAAAPVNWTVNATFADTSTMTGTFTYDAATDTVSNVNVTRNATLYTAGVSGGGDTVIWFYVPSGGPSEVGQPTVAYALAVPMTDAGGVLPIVQKGYGTCAVPTCQGLSGPVEGPAPGDQISGAVAPTVPTLSEWAMILFGLLLAGGAAWQVQRRRFA